MHLTTYLCNVRKRGESLIFEDICGFLSLLFSYFIWFSVPISPYYGMLKLLFFRLSLPFIFYFSFLTFISIFYFFLICFYFSRIFSAFIFVSTFYFYFYFYFFLFFDLLKCNYPFDIAFHFNCYDLERKTEDIAFFSLPSLQSFVKSTISPMVFFELDYAMVK